MSSNPSLPKKNCPFCGENIMEAAIVCRYCNSTLRVEDKNKAIRKINIVLSFLLVGLIIGIIISSVLLIEYTTNYSQLTSISNNQQTKINEISNSLNGYKLLEKTKDYIITQLTNNALTSTKLWGLSLSTQEALRTQIYNWEQTYCNEQPVNIDYSNNSTVSKSLQVYVGEKYGSVYDARWETIWENTRTSIHSIFGNNLYLFIVYFDEPSMGYQNLVIDVNSHCYIRT